MRPESDERRDSLVEFFSRSPHPEISLEVPRSRDLTRTIPIAPPDADAKDGENVPTATSSIAFIAYPVTDMARSVAFYADVVKLPKAGLESENWVEFDVAGITFGIGNFPQIGQPGTAGSLALEIDDLPAFRARLKEHGVDSTEPFETPICFISMAKDPDGNSLILHQAKAQ